jgi:hypothetical protein
MTLILNVFSPPTEDLLFLALDLLAEVFLADYFRADLASGAIKFYGRVDLTKKVKPELLETFVIVPSLGLNLVVLILDYVDIAFVILLLHSSSYALVITFRVVD